MRKEESNWVHDLQQNGIFSSIFSRGFPFGNLFHYRNWCYIHVAGKYTITFHPVHNFRFIDVNTQRREENKFLKKNEFLVSSGKVAGAQRYNIFWLWTVNLWNTCQKMRAYKKFIFVILAVWKKTSFWWWQGGYKIYLFSYLCVCIHVCGYTIYWASLVSSDKVFDVHTRIWYEWLAL